MNGTARVMTAARPAITKSCLITAIRWTFFRRKNQAFSLDTGSIAYG